MKNQLNNIIRLLFKPYFTSFRRMSEFFGFPNHYLPAQRMEEYAKKAIAVSNLRTMRNFLNERLSLWKKQHPDIFNELIKVKNEILNFIEIYEEKFSPKLTPYSQIEDHHPDLDLSYFSEIYTIQKAYWLGFLFADGWIGIEKKQSGNYYRIGFGQKSEDRERVIEFCKALGLNTSYIEDFKILDEEGKNYKFSRIRFLAGNVECEESMAKHLICWGMHYYLSEKIEKRVKAPILPDLRDESLMLAFLLGLFDGDGSLRLYTSPNGNKYISPHICSANKNFIEEIKKYYCDKKIVFQNYQRKIDYETGKIKILILYGLTCGTKLYQNMLSVMQNSMERKRFTSEMFYNTRLRKSLMKVLPKEKLRELLKIMPRYRIAKLLGISNSVIDRLAKNVYDLELPIRGEVSEQEIKYWRKFLNEIRDNLKE